MRPPRCVVLCRLMAVRTCCAVPSKRRRTSMFGVPRRPTACPSGVQYGHIVERARAQIEQQYRRPWLARRLRNFVYARLLMDYKKLARWARRLRWYQSSWLARAARASGLLKLLGVAELE